MKKDHPPTEHLTLVYDRRDDLLAWAAEKMGSPNMQWAPDTATIGVERGDALCAVAAYNIFSGSGCCAHIATDGSRAWASRGILAALFAYPFIQCGLDRITLPISRKNIRSQILALKLGFSFEGRLARNHDGEDEILLGMLREECPWLHRR